MHAGLVLTALPAGFALAATTSEGLLPRSWTDRGRCTLGAFLGVGALARLVAAPLTTGWLVPLLGGLGVGMGIFTRANNSLVMHAVPARTAGTGGGLLNMTRSLGTALGVALVALALHVRPAGNHLYDGPRTACSSSPPPQCSCCSPPASPQQDSRRAGSVARCGGDRGGG